MSSESIARLGIGYGPLLIARLGIGESGAATVGANLVITYSITGTVHAEYTFQHRVEGQIPQALAGGGPDEWIHPRVRKYLDDLRKRAVEERYQPAREVLETDGGHSPVRVGSIPAPASIDDADDLEEIEELLMLID